MIPPPVEPAPLPEEIMALVDRYGFAEREFARLDYRPLTPASDVEHAEGAARTARTALESAIRLALSARDRDAERLERFAGQFIETHRKHGPCDIDGGDAQDMLVECGLLESREVLAPCGEGCGCAEWDDFPMSCYFASALGQRCLDAARAEGTQP
jgi:hypothetical protein